MQGEACPQTGPDLLCLRSACGPCSMRLHYSLLGKAWKELSFDGDKEWFRGN